MRGYLIFLVLLSVSQFIRPSSEATRKDKLKLLERFNDIKALKKYLRTNTNVLMVASKSGNLPVSRLTLLGDVASEIKGIASIVLIDCGDSKKLCKKMKISPVDHEYRHYKDGEFTKIYDRQMTVRSMTAFLNDPTGDIPWDEDPTATDVVHLDNKAAMNKLFRKDPRPTLLMFYAPWCGFCKKIKPDYAAAATEVKNKYVIAAMDVNKPENSDVKEVYNITGFPTILYFTKGGKKHMTFGGENTKEGIISWLDDPQPPKPKEKEKEWAEEENEVEHLTDETFDDHIAKNSKVIVMFYAPWCGHCKAMKPDYEAAAIQMKEEKIEGSLAAVDATKHEKVSKKFEVKGFPTIKYFENGKLADFEFNGRTKEKIIEFIQDPKPPPPPEPEWDESESAVEHLTSDNFKGFIKKKKHTLVMFYAPWCGHCKKAKPEFTSAAEEIQDNPKLSLAAVNCIKHQSLCSDVNGYPTFKYFNYGKAGTKYAGGREKADFLKFIRDPDSAANVQAPPPTESAEDAWTEIPHASNVNHLSDESFDSFVKSHSSVLVMFYAPWCGHCKNMKPAYAEAAKILVDEKIEGHIAAVDATIHNSIAKKFEVKGYPTLIHFKNGAKNMEYDRSRTASDLVDFMKNPVKMKIPKVVPPKKEEFKKAPAAEDWKGLDGSDSVYHITVDNFEAFIQTYPSALIMYYAPWCGHCKAMKPDFAAAAKMAKEKNYTGVLGAVDATVHPSLAQKASVRGYPTILYYENGSFSKSYTGGRKTDDLLQFLKDPTKWKSDIPDSWEISENSTISHLNSANFTETLKKFKSSFIIFYAPWCGHCKKMKPVFEKLSGNFSENKQYFFGAVNCIIEKEICQQYKVKGYPTFIFFEYENGKQYRGYNDEESLYSFLKDPSKALNPEGGWENITGSEHVKKITSYLEINQESQTNNHLLLFFTSAWCAECDFRKKEFAKAAEILAKTGHRVKLLSLNIDFYPDIADIFKVSKAPTYYYLSRNMDRKFEYRLTKNHGQIIEFMSNPDKLIPKSDFDPAMKWINIAGSEHLNHLIQFTFKDFVAKNERTLVLFFDSNCTEEFCDIMMEEFAETAKVSKGMDFKIKLATVDIQAQKVLRKEEGADEEGNSIFLYENGKRTRDIRLYTSFDLLNFLKDPEANEPTEIVDNHDMYWSRHDPTKLVQSLTSQNAKEIFEKNDEVIAIFYDPSTMTFKALRPNFIKVAKMIASYRKWKEGSKKFDIMKDSIAEANQILLKENIFGTLAVMNADLFPEVMKNRSITETQIIYYLFGEQKEVYKLGTHVEDIIEFIKYPLPSPPIYSLAKWSLNEDTQVAHLSHQNYTQWLNDHPNSIVLFYIPACQVCVFSARDCEAFGKLWNNRIAAVKCVGKNKATCAKQEIKGYPLFVLFKDGKPKERAMDKPTRITSLKSLDIRFPTSLSGDGSDAIHEPDYSCVYVILQTDTKDERYYGYGLTFTVGRGNEIVKAAVDALSNHVVDTELSTIFSNFAVFWRKLTCDTQMRWLGPEKGVIHLATAAITNAIWDLWARIEGKPLWKLLADMTPEELVSTIDFSYITDALTKEEALDILRQGQISKQERIDKVISSGYPAYTTSAGWLGYSDEKISRLCKEALEEGFTRFKVKVGKNHEDDLHRVGLVRSLIGPDNLLMTDANQRWDVQQAIDWMIPLAKHNILWIEEPTSPDDVLGHAKISQGLKPYGIKVATGEHCQNRIIFKQFLQAGGLQYCQIDSCRLGGPNEIISVYLMAKKFNVPVCPHAGGVGLCELVQHLSIFDYICVSKTMDDRVIEYVDHLHEHFYNPTVVRKGCYQVPKEPGYSTRMKEASLLDNEYPIGKEWQKLFDEGRYARP
ncbi:DgyrCDS1382 [Dimorphilus gyrociliatus]|uniref:Mitochondrial enolase superfamily member 1 n=1 Tax=Dimorphilus gyrociliatus TaxID=2664684 RepID=A0A7I8VA07_9ANNE|nr:DgyrCDS1382 [Dimorphilus gyrociliatus]